MDLLEYAATICPFCHADKPHFTPEHVAEKGICWQMYTNWGWLLSRLKCLSGTWINSQGMDVIPEECCGMVTDLHRGPKKGTRARWLDHARYEYQRAADVWGHQLPALEARTVAVCRELGIDPTEVMAPTA